MILFYSANGNLIKLAPEPVYQGSDGATTLYFVAPINPTAFINVAFELPNGYRTAKHLLTRYTGDLNGVTDENGNAFYLWSYDLDELETAYTGTLKAQFFITLDGVIRATQAVNITIESGVPPVDEPTEGSSYDEILAYLQEFTTIPYKAKGSASVSQLNGLTKTASMNGYVYVLSNSGELVNYNGSYTGASYGDYVGFIWNGGNWRWDNFGTGVVSQDVYTKTETDTLLAGKVNVSNIGQEFFDNLYRKII